MKVKLFEESTSEYLEDAINDFLEKEDPLTIEEIKYQVTGIGAGLILTALIFYEKNDRYYTKDVIDE
mgnify:FL=1